MLRIEQDQYYRHKHKRDGFRPVTVVDPESNPDDRVVATSDKCPETGFEVDRSACGDPSIAFPPTGLGGRHKGFVAQQAIFTGQFPGV